ncbi:MAG: hypothetical protein WC499_02600 [Patescibacteria group bacterium]
METYTNDKGEVVVITEMESTRLIHAIAKYSRIENGEEIVKALKAEAIKRLSEKKENE